MADKDDSGDKTELPTAKRLLDARKKGDIAKSKDLSAALLTLTWLLLFAMVAGYVATLLGTLATDVLAVATTMPFTQAMTTIGWATAWTLIQASLVTLAPVALIATFAEFIQAGPVFTTDKLKFGLDKLNPIDGLKRMFGMDGLVELLKTLVKVALVCAIVWVVIETALRQSLDLIAMASWSPVAGSGPAVAEVTLDLTYDLTLQLFTAIVAVFLVVAGADMLYQRHSYIKKMKMSMRDIKQEYKDSDGDPMLKGQRRQMQQEWANENTLGATRGSAALLVNPTHIAIAIDYDAETCPVPVISARGAGDVAAAMRAAAEEAQVPIIRNVAAARRLWARGEIGEVVPEELFDAIAAVLVWAKKAREGEARMWHDMDSDHGANTPDPLPVTVHG